MGHHNGALLMKEAGVCAFPTKEMYVSDMGKAREGGVM